MVGIGAGADGVDRSAAAGILTVSALNRAVSALLARNFPIVRVRGEVSGFTRAASGHWYFSLKDGSAQARCVMFRGRNALLGFTPADGNRVVVVARLGLYEPRGEFQLAVEGLERDGTGQLYEEFLRRKARLEAEGLFDPGRRRPLPRVPRAVGVVTSLQAAALRDVVTTLGRRAPYVRLIVYPVPVQGGGAAESIAEMLRRCGERAEVDVLLLVRGGGSIEDLWSFNEEVVARAIAASPIPVIAGIGHESDFTIADFVADLRAPTPTAAAELVAPAAAELSNRVSDALRRAHRAAAAGVQARAQRLDYAARALQGPRAPMRGLGDRVARLSERAGQAAARALERRVAAWQGVERMRQRSAPALDGLRLAVARGRAAASAAVRRERTVLALRLDTAQRALAALDPEAVLRRGYGIIRRLDGQLVVDSRTVTAGTRVSLQFARGSAIADVVERRGPEGVTDP